ncbi:MAG: hypothetical protein IT343_05665 [Candidatus Melainabacteria bacterium]|jgi:hypothetical protein|nr:hypothetical protein [Candidatus Melainabacteria bacterium]
MKKEAALISEISYEVRTFIKDHVFSVWQLELIMHMRDRNHALTCDEIAKLLYSTPSAIESTLRRFTELGVLRLSIESADSFIYAPSTTELSQVIDLTAQAYSARRIDVINLIFSTPQKAPRLTLE